MSVMVSQMTGVSIVYSTVGSGKDQSKHQSSASLAFVMGIHWGPVNSSHKGPVTPKMFPFDDVSMHHFMVALESANVQYPAETDFTISGIWFDGVLSGDNKQTMHCTINSSPPGQNGRHFTNVFIRCIFVNENLVFWLKFHWSLFVMFQLTITQHWFR